MTKLISIVPLVALAVLASCGSSKKRSTSDPYASESDFCGQWAKAACNSDVVSKCSGGGDDTAACVASQTAFCLSILPPYYASDNAKACISAVKSAYADAELTAAEVELVRELAAPCDQLNEGPGTNGGACSDTDGCNTLLGLTCIVKPGEPAGTCQIPETAQPGQPCKNANQICTAGNYCNGSNCIARQAEGDACAADTPCREDLLCLGATGNQTCQPKADASKPCTSHEGCKSGICSIAQGTTTGICVSEIVLAPTEPVCSDLRP